MHTYTHTLVAILALSEKVKDLCVVASGIEESKVGFVVVSTMENSNGKQSEEAPVLEDPELAEMSWARFGRRFAKRSGQEIMSFQCFHTGTTTSVRKSTIRTTARGGNAALIMESDSGEYFVAISKAQGCDEIKILNPYFIGWLRRYSGPFYGETWEQIDTDVDGFLRDISGEESDEE